jgi:hypothetical protein
MELEQRIARLEAVEAIKKLKAKYFFACDNKQPELVRSCFVDGDMHIDYRRVKGEWKISKTTYRVSSTQLMDLSEGMAKVIFAGREASSGIDDPSLQAVD